MEETGKMEMISHLSEKAKRDYYLVVKARDHGDQSAYAELLKIYRDSLYYIMLRMTHNQTDAEDLTIEAFGRAFRSLRSYNHEFAFSTWLYNIATHNCIDYLRKSRRILFTDHGISEDEPGVQPEMVFDGPDPEEQVIEKQKIRMMREVVDNLKPHYRILVELRYFKEWSYEEIARELGLPLGTVKAKLFRSRDLLYQILQSKVEHI